MYLTVIVVDMIVANMGVAGVVALEVENQIIAKVYSKEAIKTKKLCDLASMKEEGRDRVARHYVKVNYLKRKEKKFL